MLLREYAYDKIFNGGNLMKRFLRLLLTITVIAPILAISTTTLLTAKAAVQQTSNNTTSSNSEAETENSTSNEDKDMSDRIAKRKAEFKEKLTTLQQTRIKNRCKQAQTGGIKSLSGRIKGIETSRNQVYSHLTDRLDKLVDKLKAKGVDTTKLESEIAELKTKIDTFKTDLATYKQEVGDLEGMDCSSDPTAFKASLETGRTGRQKLFQDGMDIRNYIRDTIKPTLKDIRSQIVAKDKTTSNNTTEGNQ